MANTENRGSDNIHIGKRKRYLNLNMMKNMMQIHMIMKMPKSFGGSGKVSAAPWQHKEHCSEEESPDHGVDQKLA